jgi:uncharacterized protein YdhG (YjbR/CyaY superfamily)
LEVARRPIRRASREEKSGDVDAYIAAFPPKVRAALRKIRSVIRRAAPLAGETLSYSIPAYKQHGILVYFAAFKNHIGMFPPIGGDAKLEQALARYRGPKGNLRFPLHEPIPFALIERIVRLRVKQDLAKSQAKAKRKP